MALRRPKCITEKKISEVFYCREGAYQLLDLRIVFCLVGLPKVTTLASHALYREIGFWERLFSLKSLNSLVYCTEREINEVKFD